MDKKDVKVDLYEMNSESVYNTLHGDKATSDKDGGIDALTGLFYTLLAFMVFSVLSDTFVVSEALLSDLLIGLLSGMTAGAVRQLIGK